MFEFDFGAQVADKKSVTAKWARHVHSIGVAGQPASQPELLLDSVLPLSGGSHSSVVEYLVEIPTRYAKCFARLENGCKVGLRDARQFAGWSGWQRRRSLLFISGGLRIELRTDPDDPVGCESPGKICGLYIESGESKLTGLSFATEKTCVANGHSPAHLHAASSGQSVRKFIALDGSQIILPAWGLTQRIN